MTVEAVSTEPDWVTAFDGTTLAARRFGADDGSPLLIANGLGANLAIWKKALIDVEREHPIATWDHRGLHDSDPPVSDRIDAGAHAEDGMAVADHYGFERFALASWSTGGRIAVEIVDRYADRVSALVLVCGSYGYSLRRLVAHLEAPSIMPLLAGVSKRFARWLEGPFRGLVNRPEVVGLVRQSGLIAATADTRALVELLQGMAACDLHTLLEMFEAVAGNAAPELLRSINAPTLVVAGERDSFTPLAQARETAELVPGAALEVYEKATHYLPIEYPARLSNDLRDFLRRRM